MARYKIVIKLIRDKRYKKIARFKVVRELREA